MTLPLFICPHTVFPSTSSPSYILGASITLLLLLTFVFYNSFLLSVPPLCCLLRSCVGFHSVLSSFQAIFIKNRVWAISIALLLFQEGYGIQVYRSGCPFCVRLSISHSYSVFLRWRVQLGSCATYNCFTQVSASLLYDAALLSDKGVEWLTFVLETMLSVFLLFHCSTHLAAHLWKCVHFYTHTLCFIFYNDFEDRLKWKAIKKREDEDEGNGDGVKWAFPGL